MPSRSTPSAVLLDYACVVATPQRPEDEAALARRAGLAIEEYRTRFWRSREPYDLGITTAAAFWSAVAGRSLTTDEVDAFTLAESSSWLHLDQDLIATTRSLAAQGVTIALVSNLPVELAEAVRADGALGHFAELFFSCDLGLQKPDPAIYRRVLERLGVDAVDGVFVDDRVENVRAAEALGLRGIVWDAPSRLTDLEALFAS